MSLEIKNVKKTYGDFSVSLDFSVDAGETLALVGPSGSGKTSALNLITGLAKEDSGSISIDGELISSLPPHKRNIAVVFQDLALFPHLNVGGNIAYSLFIKGVGKKERRKIVEETLDKVHLNGYALRRVDTLSGGERQRVAIARALASSPRALLLDEPFSSLDTPLRKELRRQFLEIRSNSKIPCVFVTHDREEAVTLGDRIALMSEGRIIETGRGRDLFLAPKTEMAARFFGAGQVLPCRILDKNEKGINIASCFGNLTVPAFSEYNLDKPLLFIPKDAIVYSENISDAGWKSFNARFIGSLFEGLSLVLRFAAEPDNNQNVLSGSSENTVFEIIAGTRTTPPAHGSLAKLWVDQSLLRFVL